MSIPRQRHFWMLSAACLMAGLLQAADYLPVGRDAGFIRIADSECGPAPRWSIGLVPADAAIGAPLLQPRVVVPRREEAGWVLYVGGWPAGLDGAFDLVIMCGDGPEAPVIRLAQALHRQTRRMDVALLLDDSYSMRTTDPQKLRVAAARLFAQLAAARGDVETLTLIAFNRRARLLLPPTPPDDTEALNTALAKLEASGATDLSSAFALANAQFSTLPPSHKLAIVLSDGRDEPGRYTFGHRRFSARRWPVYTIGLSDAIDEATLQMIANSTGGSYHRARNTDALTRIFRDIANTIHASVMIGEWPLTAKTTARVPVDDTVRILSLALIDTTDEVAACTLQAPDGVARALSTEWATDAFADIFAPAPGTWEAAGLRDATLLSVTASSPLDILPFPMPDNPTPGKPLPIAAFVLNGQEPITDVAISVRLPNGRLYMLKDDGLNADGVAGDGIFGNYLPLEALSEATLVFVAKGLTPAGQPFQRTTQRTVTFLQRELAVSQATNQLPRAQAPFSTPQARPWQTPLRPDPTQTATATTAEPFIAIVATPAQTPPQVPIAAAVRKATIEAAPSAAALLPAETDLIDVAPTTKPSWLSQFNLWSILLLVLAILFLLWLIARWFARPRLQPTRMTTFFFGSLLLHAILVLLLMNLLIQTRVITVEQISPALAVTLQSVEASLGITLTPPGPAVPLHDSVNPAEVAKAKTPQASEPVRDLELLRPATAEAVLETAAIPDVPPTPTEVPESPTEQTERAQLPQELPTAPAVVPETPELAATPPAPAPPVEAAPQGAQLARKQAVTAPVQPAASAAPEPPKKAAVPTAVTLVPVATADTADAIATAETIKPADQPTLPEAPAAAAETPVAAAPLPTEAPSTTEAAPQDAQLARQPTASPTTPVQPTAGASPKRPTKAAAPTAVTLVASMTTDTAETIAAAETIKPADTPTLPEAPAAAAETPVAAATLPAVTAETPRAAEVAPQSAQLARQQTATPTTALQPTAGASPERPTKAAVPTAVTLVTSVTAATADAIAAVETIKPANNTPTLPEAPAAAAETPIATATLPAAAAEAPHAAEAAPQTAQLARQRATVTTTPVQPVAGTTPEPPTKAAATATTAVIAAGASTPAAETPVALATASRTADTPTLPTAPAATTETPVAVATLPTVATATSHATEATPQPAQLARQRTTVTTTLAQPTAATAPEPPTQAAATATTAIIGINGTPAANNPIALATATQAAEAPTLPEAPAAPIETPAAAITRLATGAEPRPAAEPTTAAAVPIRRLLPTLPDAPVAAPTLARRILDDTAAPSPSLKAVSPPSVNLSAGAPAALQDVDTGTPLAFKIGRGGEGSRRVTIGLAQYGGDWDSARHAMTFLGYQLGERTRLAIHGSDRVVSFSSPELAQLPFVYMTGHKDFSFSEAEVANLRAYLKGGGYLWADDSTNYRDETFDTAFRRELARILPDAPLVQLGMDFEGFKTGYDLTHGYKGYAIPPGDKYRLDYIEGARLGERVAVVYTRNDYGDGLNIDAHTHPLHESLTDLGPAEMQEGAIRMGLNLTLYFLTHGQGDAAFLDQTSTTLRQQREATTAVAPAGTPRALPIFAPPARWEHEAWSDDGTLTPAGEAARITFTVGAQQKCAFSLVPESPIAVTAQDVIALQVKSDLRCGARLALALTIEGRYFESRPIYVKPGENLALFPCGEATFKTEAGGWLYHDVLPLRADIQRFSLVIYSPAPGDMHLSTPKIIRVPAQ